MVESAGEATATTNTEVNNKNYATGADSKIGKLPTGISGTSSKRCDQHLRSKTKNQNTKEEILTETTHRSSETNPVLIIPSMPSKTKVPKTSHMADNSDQKKCQQSNRRKIRLMCLMVLVLLSYTLLTTPHTVMLTVYSAGFRSDDQITSINMA